MRELLSSPPFLARLPNSWQSWFALGLLLLAVFTRFFNIRETLMFLGDQGRDAIIVKRLVKDFDPVLIGPVTSNGNMYMGPLYYYFMAPFLWLSYPDPIGPALAVATLSVLTAFFVWKWGKELLGSGFSLVPLGFVALSATLIGYSRSSWNPNPEPILGLLIFYSLHRAFRDARWLGVAIAAQALIIQTHYVTLLLAPVIGLVWVLVAWRIFRKQRSNAMLVNVQDHDQHNTWRVVCISTALGALFFLGSLVPQVVFDLTHGSLNIRAFQKFITKEDGSFSRANSERKLTKIVEEIEGRSLHMTIEMFAGKVRPRNIWLLHGIWIVLLLVFLRARMLHAEARRALWLGTMIVFVSAVGLAFYQGSVYDHYILYTIPVTAILTGILAKALWQEGAYIVFGAEQQIGVHASAIARSATWGIRLVLIALTFGWLSWNIKELPLWPIGWTVDEMKQTAETIAARIQPHEKFDIVLFAESKDLEGMNYRYLLESMGKRSAPETERQNLDALYIINENHVLTDVVNTSVYQIQVFPQKQPAEVYTVPGGPEVTVLRRITTPITCDGVFSHCGGDYLDENEEAPEEK